MALRDYFQDSMSEVQAARKKAGVPGMIGAAIRQGAGAPIAAGEALRSKIKSAVAPVGTVAKYAIGEPNFSPVRNAAATPTPTTAPRQTAPIGQPRRPITPPPTPTQAREKQTAFTNSDVQKYVGQDQSYTPLSQRLSDYQSAIRAFQDLGEAREADSLGISQETYQQQKDVRRFGKAKAAELAEQRRGIIGERVTNAPTLRAGEIANETAMNVQDIYRQLAQTKDPAEVQRLVQTVLALQGKEPAPAFDVARGGQSTVTDPVTGEAKVVTSPDVTFNRFTGEIGGSSQQAASAPPADGVYDVPGVGRVTVRGGKAYDQNGNLIE